MNLERNQTAYLLISIQENRIDPNRQTLQGPMMENCNWLILFPKTKAELIHILYYGERFPLIIFVYTYDIN